MKKHNKITMGIIGALMYLGLSVSLAGAAINCTNATIEKIGMDPSNSSTNFYMVWLTCTETAQSRRYYLSQQSLGDSGWATVLTAKSLNKTVDAAIIPNRGWNALVTDITINP